MDLKDFQNQIDVREQKLKDIGLLSWLLCDKTTGKNIIWATTNSNYMIEDDVINADIKPRWLKAKKEQQQRTKDKAEVFTPSWVCCIQNNYQDEQIFGKDVFAKVDYKNKTWETISDKIDFNKTNITWQDYTKENVLEITCGEAPYLVSRYDTVSGLFIPIQDRIGLLDRKLKVINEQNLTRDEWLNWAKEAIKHTYGYEWQGDNLLLARENILFTFVDYYYDLFVDDIDDNYIKELCDIITWNIFQMDGLKGVIPISCDDNCLACKNGLIIPESVEPSKTENSLFSRNMSINKHKGISVKLMDWDANKEIQFIDLFN